MKKTTTGLYLAALMLSVGMNGVLRADQVVMGMGFFVADEGLQQWISVPNYRTGMLIVSGALLSSPCTLETNEVALPLQRRAQGIQELYVLTLDLQGCGDGGSVNSTSSTAGRDSTMAVHSALLTGVEGGLLQPEQRMMGAGRTVLYGGANRFTYYLNEAQQQALTAQPASDRKQGKPYMDPRDNNALLRLRLDYE